MVAGMNWNRSIKVILVNLVALAAVFAIVELVLRRHINRTAGFEDGPHYRYDPKLGWAPRPGSYLEEYGPVTISPEGFRRCSLSPPPESGDSILVMGDSFAFGYAVPDDQAWPCYLSVFSGHPVLNAGVSGYGLDQMVLRLEKVIGEVDPGLVVVSLIADSVNRCRMSMRGRYKPYFDIEDGHPILLNSPVPPPSASGDCHRHWYDRLAIFRLIAEYFDEDRYHCFLIEHDQGMEVAEYLFRRARELAREHNARLLVAIQPIHDLEIGREKGYEIERYLVSLEIPVINLYARMEESFPDNQERAGLYQPPPYRHLSDAGNRWVAEAIAGFIAENDLLSGPGS